ncbi:MAG: NAD(P)/FAD-dependent oxidoreductase [Phycisphaerae bacterium]|nr:NAD(P)/FAD-dependent oxidoreductase [Phycisphaerae bacterium]
MKCDVCIIGAGPAGLFAGIIVAKRGGKVIILEHNAAACQKLLHTGGGRCNLTHSGSVNDFVRAFGPFGRFLKHSLYEFSADDLIDYFNQMGLPTVVQEDGCVFPESQRAGDVANIMINHARQSDVQIIYNTQIQSIKKESENFNLDLLNNQIQSKSLIVATGGVSWPFTGSTGDGYKYAKNFGHSIVTPKAALVSLRIEEKWLCNLSGVGLENVVIKGRAGKNKFNCSGPLMFTSKGISGPVTLDLSRYVTDLLPDYNNPAKVVIDLLPDHEISDLEYNIMDMCQKHPKKELASLLAKYLPRSLLFSICGQISPGESIFAGILKKDQRKQLTSMLKQLPISIVATDSIDGATVTRGGVSTKEINPQSMESNLCPGLFFAGEVMNVDGPCGGYNLQIAFSTGNLAAVNAL